MPLVVPGAARFAINQRLEGRAVVNVLDYRIDTTGSPMSRADAIDAQAGSIFGQWAQDIMPLSVDDLILESVSYVDLDSATGVTGSRTTGEGFTGPVAGASTADSLPANTAILVTKQGPSQRGFRNGRMYIAGAAEVRSGTTNGNELTPAAITAYQTALNSFLADTNERDTGGTAFSSDMGIVHVTVRGPSPRPGVPGPPLEGELTVVSSLAVDGLLATQRRRLRG